LLVVKVAAWRPLRNVPERSLVMQTHATPVEAKVQAISWLVSQLRWERTLGALRHERRDDALDDARKAA